MREGVLDVADKPATPGIADRSYASGYKLSAKRRKRLIR